MMAARLYGASLLFKTEMTDAVRRGKRYSMKVTASFLFLGISCMKLSPKESNCSLLVRLL